MQTLIRVLFVFPVALLIAVLETAYIGTMFAAFINTAGNVGALFAIPAAFAPVLWVNIHKSDALMQRAKRAADAYIGRRRVRAYVGNIKRNRKRAMSRAARHTAYAAKFAARAFTL